MATFQLLIIKINAELYLQVKFIEVLFHLNISVSKKLVNRKKRLKSLPKASNLLFYRCTKLHKEIGANHSNCRKQGRKFCIFIFCILFP